MVGGGRGHRASPSVELNLSILQPPTRKVLVLCPVYKGGNQVTQKLNVLTPSHLAGHWQMSPHSYLWHVSLGAVTCGRI
jgi:hypothetical protein